MSDTIAAPDEAPDLEAIVAEGTPIEIEGVPCTIARLRTRELLALLKVVTHGVGLVLKDLMDDIDWSDTQAAAAGFGGIVVLAIPEAPDEFIAFVRQVVVPEFVDGDAAENQARIETVYGALSNPDLDLLLDVFDVIAQQEVGDLATLLGKVREVLARLAPMMDQAKTKKPGKQKRAQGGGRGRGRGRST